MERINRKRSLPSPYYLWVTRMCICWEDIYKREKIIKGILKSFGSLINYENIIYTLNFKVCQILIYQLATLDEEQWLGLTSPLIYSFNSYIPRFIHNCSWCKQTHITEYDTYKKIKLNQNRANIVKALNSSKKKKKTKKILTVTIIFAPTLYRFFFNSWICIDFFFWPTFDLETKLLMVTII